VARDVLDEEERGTLARAEHGLEATTEIARAVGGEADRSRLLETIATQVQALLGARSLLILLRDGSRSEVAAAAGECAAEPLGRFLAAEAETSDGALAGARSIGIDAHAALLAPLDFGGRILGTIVALDRIEGGPGFHGEDERLLAAAAISAAAAIATVQSVTEDRLRQSLMAAERERARWARELHDTVLQGMGSRRLLLSSVLKSGDPELLRSAVEEGLRDVVRDIDELRGLISELRPATLDQLGLAAALEDLGERVGHGAEVELETELKVDAGRLDPELEIAVYRLVQEALNNVAKHAAATRVELWVRSDAERLEVRVTDDGRGFDPTEAHGGFGLIGMRERAELVGGELQIESRPGTGTKVIASVPLAPGSGSDLDETSGERVSD
jgi:signal transduction histidine kinase